MDDLEENVDCLDGDGKRINWGFNETCDLLKICLKSDCARKLTNGLVKKKKVYEEIHAQMVQLGYVKTLTQIIIKFRNLNQKYKKGLSRISKESLTRKRLQFWRLMHEVYKHRPIYRVTRIAGQAEALLRQDFETAKKIEAVLEANEFLQSQQFEKNERDLLNETQTTGSNKYSDEGNDDQHSKGKPLQNKVEEASKLDVSSVSVEIPLQESMKENSRDNVCCSSSPPPKISKLARHSSAKPHNNRSFSSKLMKRVMFSKKDRNMESYMRCTRYLVEKFKNAQEELQNNFYNQQLELQKQQQAWEEKLLQNEREYFGKILLSRDLDVAKSAGDELNDSENEII